jgi:hypothetical protein
MKSQLALAGLFAAALTLVASPKVSAQATAAGHAHKPVSAKKFNVLADRALAAMRARAAQLNITGVAVVSYAPGDSVQGWLSRMAVVGRMKDAPSDTSKGNNLIGIAYAKSAEMADTLRDSGTASRPPMTGEFGWQGGVIAKGQSGHFIVAFSGGKSEDDVQVSRAGLAVLAPVL